MEIRYSLSYKTDVMLKTKLGWLLFASFLIVTPFISAKSQRLDLAMIHKHYHFYPDKVYGIRSMKDGVHYTTLEDDWMIVKFRYEDGKAVDTIFTLDCIADTMISEISSYDLSEDEKHILFASDEEKIYRYSFQSDYYVYDLEKDSLIPVFNNGKQKLATLSPDGKKVAFVFNNNLYIKYINNDSIIQVTSDGLKNHVLNGEPDWVYEEEFALKTGYYWSPNSEYLAFYRFDESRVKEYNLLYYNDLYPELYTYKYPKAGEENALVDIFVYDLQTGSSIKMKRGAEEDTYIPRIKWLRDSKKVCLTELNRRQNKAVLYFADVKTGESYIFYQEENEKFISEFTDDFVNFVDSAALVLSEQSGYMHLYRYTLDGELVNSITSGDWEVDELLGIDKGSGEIYFTSTEESPLERYIYRVKLDGTGKEKLPSPKGNSTADFSANYAYYIMTWSDANTPFRVTLHNKQGDLIRVLEDNPDIIRRMEYYGFTDKQFFTVKNKVGMDLNCYSILPPDFKPRRKYPLLIFVYGGPEVQEVMNKWSYDMPWLQYMAQNGYVVVCMDNRGTDGRGEDFAKSTYLELGKYETEDQIVLAEYMARKSYIDKDRIGIFGWSYGGYMSLLCLTKANYIFKCAVAVAPVTNWKFYDSVYTERFMRKPQENEEGYENNSPINYVSRIKGELLLIHGNEDDNVHLQNSIKLIDEMIENDIQFESIIYPGQNHHMYRGNARYHLYQAVSDFFRKNLNN
jgi:dipeptidyl-peptidase-4